MNREAWCAVIHGVAKSRTRPSNWTELNWTEVHILWECTFKNKYAELPQRTDTLQELEDCCSTQSYEIMYMYRLFQCIIISTYPTVDFLAHWCFNFKFHFLFGVYIWILMTFEYWPDKVVKFTSVQFSSVAQSCPTLCDPMNRSMPGLPVHHQLLEFTQTHIHRVSNAIQPSHPRSSPSPPAPNPSQHQSLFHWVTSSHEVAKVWEFQL